MINKVTLEGFKCFGKRTLFPLSQVSILTGLNGRGKSTLIQAILSTTQSLTQSGLSSIEWNGALVSLGEFDDVLTRGFDSGEIGFGFETDDNVDKTLSFSLRKDNTKSQSALFSSLLVDGVDRVTEMGLMTADNERLMDADGKMLIVKELGSTSDIVSWHNFRNASYVSADRQGPVNRVKYVVQDDKLHLDVHGSNLLNILEAMTDQQRESVRKAMSEILRGGSLSVVKENEDVVLSLDSTDSGALFKPTNVGYGYGYILSTLVALELAEEKSLFVIENPEAHLHPGAQAALTEHLLQVTNAKSLQLIIETHSDHIINTCLVEVKKKRISPEAISLLFFGKEADDVCDVRRLDITDQGRVKDAPVDFFDQIDKSLEVLVGF